MNNLVRAQKLIEDARSYKRDSEDAYTKREWNRAIRRAQESVELYLKGIMKLMNVEVPKIHDVGAIFVQKIHDKKIKLEKDVEERIIFVSSYLAERRAPAFYHDEEYTEEDAQEALNGVTFISEIIEKLLNQLSK